MKIIETDNSKRCKAYVGSKLLRRAGELASEMITRCIAVIITDDITGSYYAPELEENLTRAGFTVEKIIITAGEETKNFVTLDMILNRLAEFGVTRRDVIFALGGGAVCDIAGFAACVYMRGISLVNIPTTLYSAVGSAVGGRNSLNIRAGKNLAGTIYQPDMIIVDYSLFGTVAHQNLADGYAEIIKLAVVDGGELLYILRNGELSDNIEQIIFECIRIKSRYIAVDEKDLEHFQLYNLGDTLTGAIRKCSYYSVSRGQATAAALVITAEGTFLSGMCGCECRDIIRELLDKLNVNPSCGYSAGNLWYAALSNYISGPDEKIPIIIPVAPGACELRYITPDELYDIINLGRTALGND